MVPVARRRHSLARHESAGESAKQSTGVVGTTPTQRTRALDCTEHRSYATTCGTLLQMCAFGDAPLISNVRLNRIEHGRPSDKNLAKLRTNARTEIKTEEGSSTSDLLRARGLTRSRSGSGCHGLHRVRCGGRGMGRSRNRLGAGRVRHCSHCAFRVEQVVFTGA
jgi:hypothetical protein